jgi:hypothetical protein
MNWFEVIGDDKQDGCDSTSLAPSIVSYSLHSCCLSLRTLRPLRLCVEVLIYEKIGKGSNLPRSTFSDGDFSHPSMTVA